MSSDRYEIGELLGASSGLMGPTFLATDSKSQRKNALKVIEAKDHSDAQLIVSQLAELQELKHPYIVQPSQVYTAFDAKISATYVHVVRPFSAKGALDTLLRNKRMAGEKIEELQVKKWIGQLIDVLRFLNSKNAMHRNLKPANLLIGASNEQTDAETEDTLLVCDFGVAAVMADCRTKTRRNAEAYHAAPESVRHPFDQRCDYWSFGACLLETCTCHLVAESDILKILLDMKRSSQVISGLLENISESYSPELSALIGGLLKVDPAKRLTLEDLLHSQYVQECLELTDSATVHRRIRQSMTIIERPLPQYDDFNEQMGALVSYIDQEINNELCVLEALKTLAFLHHHQQQIVVKHVSRPKSRLSNFDLQNINHVTQMLASLSRAVEENVISEEVCAYGMQVVALLVKRLPVKSMNELPSVAKLVLQCLKEHPRSIDVYAAGGHLVSLICSNYNTAVKLGDRNAVQFLCSALRLAVEHENVRSEYELTKLIDFYCSVCAGLWALSTVALNVLAAQHSGVFLPLLELVKRHAENIEVLTSVTAVLQALSNADLPLENIFSSNAIYVLMKVGLHQIQHPKLFRNIILTLAAFAHLTDEAAFTVVECESPDKSEVLTGVHLISRAFDNHRDNLEVVEAVVDLIEALLSHHEMLEFIPSKWELIDTVKSFGNRFKNHKRITQVCEASIVKLEQIIDQQ